MVAGRPVSRPERAAVGSVHSIRSIGPPQRAATSEFPDWPRYSITTIDLARSGGESREELVEEKETVEERSSEESKVRFAVSFSRREARRLVVLIRDISRHLDGASASPSRKCGPGLPL